MKEIKMSEEAKRKIVKLGQVKKGKYGSYISTGNVRNKDPKYNYTVQIRVLEGSPQTPEELKKAKVLFMATNPSIQMRDPHENAPDFIEQELTVSLPEES